MRFPRGVSLSAVLTILLSVLFCTVSAADPDAPHTSLGSDDRIHYIALDTMLQSDSFLIESNGKYMLVDTSYPDPPTGGWAVNVNDEGNIRRVIAYLKEQGISHLDYLVITHNHSDHNGGVQRLCEAGFVDENTTAWYRTAQPTIEDFESREWGNYMYMRIACKALEDVGAEVICLEDAGITDLTVRMGDFTIQFLNLDNDRDGVVDFSYDNENLNSIVLKVSKREIDTLLAADIEDENEYALLEAEDLHSIEILKAAHHGSITSGTYEFLSTIKPEVTVVTSSSIRQPGAYAYLKNIGSRIYTTERCTADAIIETVYDDSYTFENAELYDVPQRDGWIEWFDHRMFIERGRPVIDRLHPVAGNWYYFDEDGIMQTGEVTTADGRNYYFDEDGIMQTGLMEIDGVTRYFPAFMPPRLPGLAERPAFPGRPGQDEQQQETASGPPFQPGPPPRADGPRST